MKPLGSITKDFPFLDTNTRNEIESIMQAATNYCDFANSLAERAADPNSTPLIVFLSLYHASRFQNSVVVETVTNAHPDLPIPIPFTYGYDDYVDVVETIHRAIELIQNSAITFYLLMRLYRASTIGSPEENKTQKMIDNLLRTDKKLRLHSADYLQHIGRRMRFDSQPERAVEYFKRALQLARESDDQWHLVLLSISIGHVESQFTRSTDHYSKAMEYFTEATTISKALGYQNGIATVLNNMAVYSASRGELDEAIACQIEAAQITSELGIVAASTSYNLAGWYASLDDGATSLEWAKISLEQMGGPYAHIAMASAYLALDKYKDVES
ncbi:MAG: tetratricopeptide repeat protein, partial [Candidatus Thorarchaeota archaeon]